MEPIPTSPLGHLALADALHALGHEERMRVEVRRAFTIGKTLVPGRNARSSRSPAYRETTKGNGWPPSHSTVP